jgi:hypothetical protein
MRQWRKKSGERKGPGQLVRITMVAIACLSIGANANGQYRDWKSRIDEMVEKADSLSMHSHVMFYSERILRNDEVIKETWHYTMEKDRVIVFQVRYMQGNSEITEVYYVDRNELICMEKIQAPNAAEFIDEVQSGELYFLENRALRQYVSYGRKPAQFGYSTAGYNCLSNFENRWAELRRNIQIVNATRKRS